MVYDYFDKYTFLCEMYDDVRDLFVEILLNFFPYDNSVRVIDPIKGKTLLRRAVYPPVSVDMLRIGRIVNIFSYPLLIKDSSPLTDKLLPTHEESTFAMIKPTSPSKYGKIMTYIIQKGFRIVRMKNAIISKDFAQRLYDDESGSSSLPYVINYVTTSEVIGLEIVAPNAVSKWRECLGAADPKMAAPGTVRYLFGDNILENAVHGCKTLENATEIIELFFGYENGRPRIEFRATFKDCTCCIIKPHAILDGNLGLIIDQIITSGKFVISAMGTFSVDITNAKEFYEVYKGVLPEYEDMSYQLADGICQILEVKSVDSKVNVVSEFRKLCGPRDPACKLFQELARQLYPDSIRALYGKTIVCNAVHCTDLPEDGVEEVEYFYKLLNH